MDNWKKISPDLDFIAKLPVVQREKFLKTAKPAIIKKLVNVVYNLISPGNVPLSLDAINKLRPLKNKLINLCMKRKSLKQRRTELIDKDCLGKFLAIVIPILNEILFVKKENNGVFRTKDTNNEGGIESNTESKPVKEPQHERHTTEENKFGEK